MQRESTSDAAADAESAALGETAGYRPVSGPAVAAAAVGCLAALAVVSPVFWVVPLVGAALALVAVRDVTRGDAAKAGGLAAVAGLGLSLGFGAQAVTAAATARCLAAARAEAVAGFWLDAVCDGRAADARGMCGPDAASRVEEAAACCNGGAPRIHCAGAAEVPGSWAVTVSRGDCRLELVVEPAVSTTAGRATERWLVTSLVRSPARGGQ